MKLRFPRTTELSILGICLLVIFFGPFNIWWNIVLLLGIGLFIIGMAAFIIYTASSAMNFIRKGDYKKTKELSKE